MGLGHASRACRRKKTRKSPILLRKLFPVVISVLFCHGAGVVDDSEEAGPQFVNLFYKGSGVEVCN